MKGRMLEHAGITAQMVGSSCLLAKDLAEIEEWQSEMQVSIARSGSRGVAVIPEGPYAVPRLAVGA